MELKVETVDHRLNSKVRQQQQNGSFLDELSVREIVLTTTNKLKSFLKSDWFGSFGFFKYVSIYGVFAVTLH